MSNKLAYLTIAPVPFGQEFDLDAVNEMTQQAFGRALFGYQKFFMDNLDNGRAAELLEDKHDRMEMLVFAKDTEKLMLEYFCAIGGLEKWLLSEEKADMIEGVTDTILSQRRITFQKSTESEGHTGDARPGYAGPLNWYVSHNRDLNVADEREHASDWQTYKTDKRTLLVTCSQDPASNEAMHTQMAQSYVVNADSQLTVKSLESGHFPMLEKSEESSKILETFFAE